MQLTLRLTLATLLSVLLVAANESFLASSAQAREKLLLDEDWSLLVSMQPHDNEMQGKPKPRRQVNLPHDFTIELPTDPDSISIGGGGFFQTGSAVYRKQFEVPESWASKRVWVEFEGVAPRCEVLFNGESLGKHPYAYTPIWRELTHKLQPGETNELVVQVDDTQHPSSRWYAGAGIYRHVWLHAFEPVHLDAERVFVSTEKTSSENATLTIEVPVSNESSDAARSALDLEVLDPSGKACAQETIDVSLAAGEEQTLRQQLEIAEPKLWSLDSPDLYQLRLRLRAPQGDLDEVTIPFGIRTLSITAKQGVQINGQEVKLFGANVHHDHGPLGSASFDAAEQRRVRLLKEAGFTAIRTSHNPPSKAFLRACDEQGMLVLCEFFDGWAAKKTKLDYATVFHNAWQQDVSSTVIRDRNHPSVIMWSIGNEVYERGKPSGPKIAHDLTAEVKRLDPTRPVTAGICGLWGAGDWPLLDPLFAKLDVAGYNYELHRHAEDHARLPERIIYCSESYPRDAFPSWQLTMQAPYVLGDFVWSGIDYLGEAGIGRVFDVNEKKLPHWEGNHYPWHGAACGDIDLTGWRKPVSHYRNIVWDRGEKLYSSVRVPEPSGREWQLTQWASDPSLPCWTWKGREGELFTVEVFSRYPLVRLYLNDKLIGEQQTGESNQFRVEFQVEYQPGTLRAVGVEEGEEKESMEIATAGEPAAIELRSSREALEADGQDVAFVDAIVVDSEGRRCWHSEASIEYQVTGPATIAGIGSGDLTSRESYRDNPRKAYQGQGQVILRSSKDTGVVKLQASSPTLDAASFEIESR